MEISKLGCNNYAFKILKANMKKTKLKFLDRPGKILTSPLYTRNYLELSFIIIATKITNNK